MKKYDYLIVGGGLYGAVFAYLATQQGKKCLVIDKRAHLGGNLYCEEKEGIHVHKYGAHIFHTSNKEVWNFVNSLTEFNRYTNSPVANYKGKIYNLPFNMNTFYSLWGVTTPQQAKAIIEEQCKDSYKEYPANLEEQALSLVGHDIYNILIKGYTEKQWGRDCKELPAFIIKRLPLRFTYDNNYFNDLYQGIPIKGYNEMFRKLLEGVDCMTNTDFFSDREYFEQISDNIVYTGKIDQYYNYCFGKLEYRSLLFEEELIASENYQGNAVVNFTDKSIPYTRIIEHKHFVYGKQPMTIITKEYPLEWQDGNEPYYPINDEKNTGLYQKYLELAKKEPNIHFGGRLAEYKYYDMHQIIEKVISLFRENIY